MRVNKIIVPLLLAALISGSVLAQAKKHVVKAAPHPSGLAANIAAGKVVYGKICVTCHMADGLGVPNMNPPLVKTKYVLGPKPKLMSIVLKGFNETIDIGDETYSNVMPSQAYLTDKEIADVLTYVRNNFGNKASAVTIAEVKKARAAKK